MTKPMVRIHNAETDEVIDRRMTDDEFTQYQKDQELEVAKQAEAEAKAAKRAELLSKLGINEEEARILLG